MSRLTIKEARDYMMRHATDAIGTVAAQSISYPGVPFTQPAAGEWARITIKFAARRQRALGDQKRKFVAGGILCIELFTVPGDGGLRKDGLADAAVLYLETMVSSPITYRNIRAVDIGDDGGYEKTNIEAEFEYEDHH